jgi:nicotinamidase-related amidase
MIMLDRNHTVLVVVDMQERMLPAIHGHEEVLANVVKLIEGFHRLAIPMLVTEQYPKGLGATVEGVREAMMEWYIPVEKMSFSACGDLHFMNQLEAVGKGNVVLCGVESHVCVYQTAMDLRNLGYNVQVVADAIGSRSESNYRIALEAMMRRGIEATSVEMVLFELMVRADIPEFKDVQRIVK